MGHYFLSKKFKRVLSRPKLTFFFLEFLVAWTITCLVVFEIAGIGTIKENLGNLR